MAALAVVQVRKLKDKTKRIPENLLIDYSSPENKFERQIRLSAAHKRDVTAIERPSMMTDSIPL
jgi:hypothetical protein